MNIDIDLLQELFNDTTDGLWKSSDTKLLISTLNGGYDVYDVQSCGDAAFIAYAHNNMQEIIEKIRENEIDIDAMGFDDDMESKKFMNAYERGDTATVDKMLQESLKDILLAESEVD